MEDGRIHKDLLYGEIIPANRPVGRPKLRFKNACKRDMKSLNVPIDTWESHADDWPVLRTHLTKRIQAHDKK